MKGILVTGGEQPDFHYVSHFFSDASAKKSYICAVDSGLDYCVQNSIRPDYILGDMDSLSDAELLNNFPSQIIEKHPSEKDFTDSELGLNHLRLQGCSEIIIIGGGGGRLDHLLALLSLYERPKPPDLWFTSHEKIYHIVEQFNECGTPGELLSFFPVGSEKCRMNSQGLKWPLDNLQWKKGDIGISNRLEASEFSITMKTGRLILIRGLKKEFQSS